MCRQRHAHDSFVSQVNPENPCTSSGTSHHSRTQHPLIVAHPYETWQLTHHSELDVISGTVNAPVVEQYN